MGMRCTHWLETKQRVCKFERYTATDPFCAFHSKTESRIPCPLDPNHTIFRYDRDSHVKKCTSRPAEVVPAWYSKNHNMGLASDENENNVEDDDDGTRSTELRRLDRETVFGVFEIARRVTESKSAVVSDTRHHAVLDDRIEAMTNVKHARQQASLIGLLEHHDLLTRTDLFIEWGSGRAEFSRYIGRTYLPPYTTPATGTTSSMHNLRRFLMIDRDGGRLKHDRRMVEDYRRHGIDARNHIKRQKVDIAHIKLDQLVEMEFPSTTTTLRVCSVSKHLCGAATDLTINCLTRSNVDSVGILLALCCHHRCSWRALNPVSRAFLSDRGITPTTFRILADLGAWWTNGMRDGMDGESSGTHWTGLTHRERELVGWQCKRTIDLSRVAALHAAGYDAKLIKYVDEDVTRECVALLATPR